MAQLIVDQNSIRVAMSRSERILALHVDVVVAIDDVVEVAAVEDLWTQLRGYRAPGTGIPGVIMLGTSRSGGEKDFCVVRGHRPGIVVTLSKGEFARLLVTDDEAVARATEINDELESLRAGR